MFSVKFQDAEKGHRHVSASACVEKKRRASVMLVDTASSGAQRRQPWDLCNEF
jgi:hypothetical protein